MLCSKCGCDSTIKQGNQLLCDKHYRFGQMRSTAKKAGKSVPSHQQLEEMSEKGMQCWDCGAMMNWRGRDNQQRVLSLQHYRDGTYGFVCRSCNTRHAFMEQDSYREIPKDHKLCPCCQLVLPDIEFCSDNARSGQRKKKSHCRSCSAKAHEEWIAKNKDRYNAYQREWRAKKKEARKQ